jgi:hypothetical protein
MSFSVTTVIKFFCTFICTTIIKLILTGIIFHNYVLLEYILTFALVSKHEYCLLASSIKRFFLTLVILPTYSFQPLQAYL